jgi:hypothetical protein
MLFPEGCRENVTDITGARIAIFRIYDPVQLTHSKLREFAFIAAWISVLVETVQELEDLNIGLTPEDRQLPDFNTRWPWYFDAVSLAQFVIQMNREEAELGFKSCWPPGWAKTERTGQYCA